jgi:AcrR family transcriptional regulator
MDEQPGRERRERRERREPRPRRERREPRPRRERLTREEKRAHIRSSLVEAASELFDERGYWGVSIDEIADRAGVTKGAVYSNFESKEDLLMAVTWEHRTEVDEQSIREDPSPLPELARKLGVEIARLATSEAILSNAPRELELATLSLTSEKVRTALTALMRMQRDYLAAFIRERAEQEGVDLILPAEEIAIIFRAVASGLTRMRALHADSVPESYFADAFTLVLAGSTRPRRTSKKTR